MEDRWILKIKEEKEDLKSRGDKGVNVKMTDKQYTNLTLYALKVGLNSAAELLEQFTGDLTEFHSKGSDERMLASQWFDRAFGIWEDTQYYFRYYLYNNDINVEELLKYEDYFEEIYNEYLEESTHKQHESKEECLTIIKDLLGKL